MDSMQIQEKALRDGIAQMMSECSEKQRAFMNRIHDNAPWKGLANCPAGKLAETYNLLDRTQRGVTP